MNQQIKKIIVVIIFVQFIPSLFAFFLFFNDGSYVVERLHYNLDFQSLIYATVLFIFSMFFMFFSFFISRRSIKPINIKETRYSLFILVLQILFFIANFHYGTNVAGVSDKKMPGFISYFFILFNPDMLFVIYLFLTEKSKLKYTNIFIYLISMITRGWMGGFLYIIIYLLLTAKITRKNIFNLFVLFLFFLAILPFIINAKWAFRSLEPSVVLSAIFHVENYFSQLLDALSYVVLRLQSLSSLIFIIDNQNIINGDVIKPYWLEGNFQLIILKLLSIDLPSLNNYLVTHVMGYKNALWNIQTGCFSWVIISPFDLFIYFYVFFIIFIGNAMRVIRHSYLMQSFFLYVIFSRLFVGWFSAYWDVMISLIVTSLLLSLFFTNKSRRVL